MLDMNRRRESQSSIIDNDFVRRSQIRCSCSEIVGGIQRKSRKIYAAGRAAKKSARTSTEQNKRRLNRFLAHFNRIAKLVVKRLKPGVPIGLCEPKSIQCIVNVVARNGISSRHINSLAKPLKKRDQARVKRLDRREGKQLRQLRVSEVAATKSVANRTVK